MFSSQYVPTFSVIRPLCDIHLHQAAIGVGDSYDALGDLFECVANFLTRLHIYTEKIQLPQTMSDIVVKVVVEVLNVLALAQKQITLGRFSKRHTSCWSSLADLLQRNSQRNYLERTRLRPSYSD